MPPEPDVNVYTIEPPPTTPGRFTDTQPHVVPNLSSIDDQNVENIFPQQEAISDYGTENFLFLERYVIF